MAATTTSELRTKEKQIQKNNLKKITLSSQSSFPSWVCLQNEFRKMVFIKLSRQRRIPSASSVGEYQPTS
jgi:hypothetical protein